MAEADEIIAKLNKRYYDKYEKKPKPVWQNLLVYDSAAETLEPVYFWILDFTEGLGFKIEKLVDNFTASPGSGYFAEIGARATRMQEEGMKILGAVNTVIKSIINIIYDLKEFEIRLKHYDAAKSSVEAEKEAGMLALKQIWMDNVDIKRGRGSINMLTYELGFTTLRDAFIKAKSPSDIDKMDLNERVKRILKPRIAEFLEWWKRSETELRKRYEIERSYLKSQISALRLYTRWAKPYLKAAEQLRMKEAKLTMPHLVNIFNTVLLELSLMAIQPIDVAAEAYNKNLPIRFANKKMRRKYYSCVFVDFMFRGIPRRIPEAHFVFGGRSEVNFRAFSLNEDELLMLKYELDKSDIGDALRLVEITTAESLAELQKDIEYFVKKEEKIKEKIENPFVALFSFLKKKKEEKKVEERPLTILTPEEEKKVEKLEREGIKPDSHVEKVVRELAEMKAAEACYRIFDVYKKAHDMASWPGGPEFLELFRSKWRTTAGF